MYRRFGLLYVLFSLLVLAVLVVIFIVRLNTAREFNIQEAQTSFIRLQGRVRAALVEGDSTSEAAIREYTQSVPTVRAVVIYNPDLGLRYVWTSSVDYLDFSQSNLAEVRGFPAYEYSEISEYRLRAPLTEVASSQLYMDGIYRVLSFSDAYVPLRDSLISLIAFAFVTVLIAVAMNLSRNAELSGTEHADRGGVEPPPAAGETTGERQPRSARASYAAVEPAPVAAQPAAPASAPVAAPETHAVAAEEPVMEEVDIEEIATDPGEPGTLFNPVTNLSYREHLQKRLGLELERSAYNDQDLTCMLVHFVDAEGSDEAYAERAQQVLAAFKFEDLCFEYGRARFCVILPNTELSRGIREAETFKSDHAGTMYFGLSARNGRLVEATRVLGEAERSLEHARKEPGGIVGFRPDPRKYRQFVTRHLGPQE